MHANFHKLRWPKLIWWSAGCASSNGLTSVWRYSLVSFTVPLDVKNLFQNVLQTPRSQPCRCAWQIAFQRESRCPQDYILLSFYSMNMYLIILYPTSRNPSPTKYLQQNT